MPQGKLLYGWDDTNQEWVKLQVDESGYVKVDLSQIDLNDLADVNAPAPDDNDALTWDAATSKWVPEAVAAAAGSVVVAYLSAAQTSLVHDTWTKVELDSEEIDSLGEFNTTTYKFVCTVAGYYKITGRLLYGGVGCLADKEFYCGIYLNGSLVKGLKSHSAVAVNVSAETSGILELAVDDEIELYARHKTGVNTVDLHSTNDSVYTSLEIHAL